MPTVKVQDSDGVEQRIIGNAVIGLGISDDTYVAKIVSREKELVSKVISATIKYFLDKYPVELKKAIERYKL